MGPSALAEMAASTASSATTTSSSISVIPRAGAVRIPVPHRARSVRTKLPRAFAGLHLQAENFARPRSAQDADRRGRRRSPFPVDLPAGLPELLRLLRHPLLHLGGVVADLLGDLHRAELGPAHRAEVGHLRSLGGQG